MLKQHAQISIPPGFLHDLNDCVASEGIAEKLADNVNDHCDLHADMGQ